MRALMLGLVALALASGAALYLFWPSKKPTEVVKLKKPEEVFVLVATKPLAAGHKIDRADVDWLPWPKEGLETIYVRTNAKSTEPKAIVGQMVRRAIAKGTPMTKRLIFDPGEGGFLAGALDPGMRAVTINVKPATGGIGFITPGDRVDVILTQDISRVAPRRRGQRVIANRVVRHSAEAILHDLRVIAVDRKVDETGKEPKAAKTVTVEVTPRQAETIAVALAMGKLSVTLRSLAAPEKEEDSEAGFTTDLDISRTFQASFGAPTAAGPPRVRVFRAGQASSAGN